MKSPEEIDKLYADGHMTIEEAVEGKLQWITEHIRDAFSREETAKDVRASNEKWLYQADQAMAFWMKELPEIEKPKLTADYAYDEKLQVFRLVGLSIGYKFPLKHPIKIISCKLNDDLPD